MVSAKSIIALNTAVRLISRTQIGQKKSPTLLVFVNHVFQRLFVKMYKFVLRDCLKTAVTLIQEEGIHVAIQFQLRTRQNNIFSSFTNHFFPKIERAHLGKTAKLKQNGSCFIITEGNKKKLTDDNHNGFISLYFRFIKRPPFSWTHISSQ